MIKSAIISEDKVYRYILMRVWDSSKPRCLFICLNPSTADESKDDPTVRRCIGFAKEWGFGSLAIGNVFALRATSPKELLGHRDPAGIENGAHLSALKVACDEYIMAWGAHSIVTTSLSLQVTKLFPNPKCLGVNKDGSPKHPLYLPKNSKRIAYIHPGLMQILKLW